MTNTYDNLTSRELLYHFVFAVEHDLTVSDTTKKGLRVNLLTVINIYEGRIFPEDFTQVTVTNSK